MPKTKPIETIASLAARIQMRRMRAEEDILVVEGPLDEMLYEGYVCGTCKIARGGTKDKIIGAINALIVRGFHDAVAIVDADFDHIKGKSYGPSIFLTDTHDVETMMCAEVLSGFLKAKCKGPVKADRLLVAISEISKWIGICRYRYRYAYKDKSGNSLDFKKFIKFNSNLPILDFDLFFDELERFNTPIAQSDRAKITVFINSQAPKVAGLRVWQFSQGHDLVNTVLVVLEHLAVPMNADEIEQLILELYKSRDAFLKTKVYQTVMSSPCSIWAN